MFGNYKDAVQSVPSHLCDDGDGNECGVLVRKSEGKHFYEDVGVRGRMILKWLLNKYNCIALSGISFLSRVASIRLL
jgi:hypothetical protein